MSRARKAVVALSETLSSISKYTRTTTVGSAGSMPLALCQKVNIATSATMKTAHKKALTSPYPGSDVARSSVKEDDLSWSKNAPDYKPVEYTAPVVLGSPPWADHATELKSYAFNKNKGGLDRTSTQKYTLEKDTGRPVNPVGRTGMRGRGLLGRWGPNHAADPIVTRWARDAEGKVVTDKNNGDPLLEFVAIKRKDNGEWAIPGGMVDAGETVTATLKREFGEETMDTLNASKTELKDIKKNIKALFKKGDTIYKGYVDDPRNTDNAWMETVAVNYHDNTGVATSKFTLNAGDDAGAVTWMRINDDLQLFASHVDFLRAVKEKRLAGYKKK